MNSTPRSVSRTGVALPGLVALDLFGPFRRQLRAPARAAEIAHRDVDQALGELPRRLAAGETRAHGFGLALALAEGGAALACRHDEDHLLQHVFRRRRLGAALLAACVAPPPARSAAALGAVARRQRPVQPIWARMNSLKCARSRRPVEDAVELLDRHLVGRGEIRDRRRRPAASVIADVEPLAPLSCAAPARPALGIAPLRCAAA